MDNKRIYVVMPKVLSVGKKTIPLPCGMAMAQSSHVVSKLKLTHVSNGTTEHSLRTRLQTMLKPITTIDKQCRDQAELNHIKKLATDNKIFFVSFFDTNEKLYGVGVEVETAVAFGPCTKEEVVGVLDYVPLWECACHKAI